MKAKTIIIDLNDDHVDFAMLTPNEMFRASMILDANIMIALNISAQELDFAKVLVAKQMITELSQ